MPCRPARSTTHAAATTSSIGGAGDDYLNGDANGSLFGNARGGDDLLIDASGNDTAYGTISLFGSAVGGNDLFVGGAGDDLLYGDGTLTQLG